MSFLAGFLSATNFKNPFLRTLVPAIGLAYGIQAAVAIPSIVAQSERFYDLSGSITYISCTALSLFMPAIRARSAARLAGLAIPSFPSLFGAFKGASHGAGFDWRQAALGTASLGFNWRQVVLSAAVSVWATRLGSYLFQRIMSDGEDSRFEKIRYEPSKFAVAFFAQATWVTLCLMPVLAINSLPVSTFAALGGLVSITDIVGILLYVGGLSFEVAADRQKSKWVQEKKEKKHDEDFLTRGLWSKSRHPNYFGESTLWTGIATVSAGVLASNAGMKGMGLSGGLGSKAVALLAAGVSPAFVTFLLLKISGVPLSENKYDKRYGDREDYKKWKRETPMFFPKL